MEIYADFLHTPSPGWWRGKQKINKKYLTTECWAWGRNIKGATSSNFSWKKQNSRTKSANTHLHKTSRARLFGMSERFVAGQCKQKTWTRVLRERKRRTFNFYWENDQMFDLLKIIPIIWCQKRTAKRIQFEEFPAREGSPLGHTYNSALMPLMLADERLMIQEGRTPTMRWHGCRLLTLPTP